jgi:hypothetical protein
MTDSIIPRPAQNDNSLLGDPSVADGRVGIRIGILRGCGALRIVDDPVLREHRLVVAFAAQRAVVADVLTLVDWREELQGFLAGDSHGDIAVIWNPRTCCGPLIAI